MDPYAEAFLQRLREANAEDLRKRVLTSARAIIEKGGLLPERLSQVTIDFSDYLEIEKQD